MKKKVMAGLLAMILVVLCVTFAFLWKKQRKNEIQEIPQTPQTEQSQTEEELIYDEDGMVYQYIRTDGYEVKTNINQMKRIEEIPLYSGNSKSVETYMIENTMNGKKYKVTYIGIPNIFMTEDSIVNIRYMVQNVVGSIYKKLPDVKFQNSYSSIICDENVPVDLEPESKEQLYLKLYTVVENQNTFLEEQALIEQIQTAVIRADITYGDGTKETKYAGLKSASQYNANYMYFNELVME